eukprot:scaffold20352_cov28-Tisochrysis_lutea.AAC.9
MGLSTDGVDGGGGGDASAMMGGGGKTWSAFGGFVSTGEAAIVGGGGAAAGGSSIVTGEEAIECRAGATSLDVGVDISGEKDVGAAVGAVLSGLADGARSCSRN